MPQKSSKNLSPSAASPTKFGRGRPRKYIDPNALGAFEKFKIEPIEIIEKSAETKQPPISKRSDQRMSPVTSERSYSADEVEFMNALSEFKRTTGRTFPTCSEILTVLRSLGYVKGHGHTSGGH